jgi:hypothetical protein
MEWFTGLALLPALVCAAMMGGMALAAVFGWRRTQAPSAETQTPPAETNATDTDAPKTLEDAPR